MTSPASMFILRPPQGPVWPWDVEGTSWQDCLLNNERLPSVPERNARPPENTHPVDPVPVLVPVKVKDNGSYVPGMVRESDPDETTY